MPCLTCGTEVRRSPSTLTRSNGRAYCSQACYRADPAKPKRKQRVDTGTPKAPRVVRPCDFCGVDVERADYAMRSARVYCSRACSGAAAKRDGRPGRPGSRKPGDSLIDSYGYVRVWVGPDHPMSHKGWALEHRVVMAEIIGRPLTQAEQVHHRNGDRQDNRPENLELWVRSQPNGQRVPELVAWARQILDTYEPVVERLP